MWNDELKTLNDFPCLRSHDLWYLDPVSLNDRNAQNTLNLHMAFPFGKASYDVKWWAEDFGLLSCLPYSDLVYFVPIFLYIVLFQDKQEYW